MEPTRCYDCGFILGAYYEAWVAAKEAIISKSRDPAIDATKIMLDTRNNDNLMPLFAAFSLRLKKYCCRAHLAAICLASNVQTVGGAGTNIMPSVAVAQPPT